MEILLDRIPTIPVAHILTLRNLYHSGPVSASSSFPDGPVRNWDYAHCELCFTRAISSLRATLWACYHLYAHCGVVARWISSS